MSGTERDTGIMQRDEDSFTKIEARHLLGLVFMKERDLDKELKMWRAVRGEIQRMLSQDT